jgi:hypothetical protein
MTRKPFWLALAVGGCGLINANILHYDYDFDVEQFSQSVGDKNQSGTLPNIPCTVGASPDPCTAMSLPAGLTGACVDGSCQASADVRLSYPVDLSKANTPLPPAVLQYSIDHVSIKRIAYWVVHDGLNVPVPKIDLYVAAAGAKDETDRSAVQVGSVAMLPAKAVACADSVDSDAAAPSGKTVCDVPLTDAGQAALANFVKQAASPSTQVPFQLIAHTKVTAKAGDPIPSGDLQFAVHPSVSFSLLK